MSNVISQSMSAIVKGVLIQLLCNIYFGDNWHSLWSASCSSLFLLPGCGGREWGDPVISLHVSNVTTKILLSDHFNLSSQMFFFTFIKMNLASIKSKETKQLISFWFFDLLIFALSHYKLHHEKSYFSLGWLMIIHSCISHPHPQMEILSIMPKSCDVSSQSPSLYGLVPNLLL